jgi:hypothetical protein
MSRDQEYPLSETAPPQFLATSCLPEVSLPIRNLQASVYPICLYTDAPDHNYTKKYF